MRPGVRLYSQSLVLIHTSFFMIVMGYEFKVPDYKPVKAFVGKGHYNSWQAQAAGLIMGLSKCIQVVFIVTFRFKAQRKEINPDPKIKKQASRLLIVLDNLDNMPCNKPQNGLYCLSLAD
jgi:hypothetical protein